MVLEKTWLVFREAVRGLCFILLAFLIAKAVLWLKKGSSSAWFFQPYSWDDASFNSSMLAPTALYSSLGMMVLATATLCKQGFQGSWTEAPTRWQIQSLLRYAKPNMAAALQNMSFPQTETYEQLKESIPLPVLIKGPKDAFDSAHPFAARGYAIEDLDDFYVYSSCLSMNQGVGGGNVCARSRDVADFYLSLLSGAFFADNLLTDFVSVFGLLSDPMANGADDIFGKNVPHSLANNLLQFYSGNDYIYSAGFQIKRDWGAWLQSLHTSTENFKLAHRSSLPAIGHGGETNGSSSECFGVRCAEFSALVCLLINTENCNGLLPFTFKLLNELLASLEAKGFVDDEEAQSWFQNGLSWVQTRCPFLEVSCTFAASSSGWQWNYSCGSSSLSTELFFPLGSLVSKTTTVLNALCCLRATLPDDISLTALWHAFMGTKVLDWLNDAVLEDGKGVLTLLQKALWSPSGNFERITLGHLAFHRSGLFDVPWDDPETFICYVGEAFGPAAWARFSQRPLFLLSAMMAYSQQYSSGPFRLGPILN